MREIDPTFPIEDRNYYLGMVVDGVNPYGNQNLNIPPSLCS